MGFRFAGCSGCYTKRYVDGYVSYKLFPRVDEDALAAWIQPKWRKNHDPDNPVSGAQFADRWLTELKLLEAAKSFSDDELKVIIARAIQSEKTYPERSWANLKDALLFYSAMPVLCVVMFVFGHGVFFVVLWIVRGFRS